VSATSVEALTSRSGNAPLPHEQERGDVSVKGADARLHRKSRPLGLLIREEPMTHGRHESPLLRPFLHFQQPGSAWWTHAVTFHRRRMIVNVDGTPCTVWAAIHAIETEIERSDEFSLFADLVLWPRLG
jgi:hypothetical protein